MMGWWGTPLLDAPPSSHGFPAIPDEVSVLMPIFRQIELKHKGMNYLAQGHV